MRHTHDRPHKHRNTAFSAELTMDRGEKTISAELRFADPVSDIAVFGKPDDQVLYEKAWLGTVRGLLGFLEAPAKLLATSLKSPELDDGPWPIGSRRTSCRTPRARSTD